MDQADADQQQAERVHQELLDRLALLAAAEERYVHISEMREAARTAVGDSLRRARAALDLADAKPDLALAHNIYWETRVRVEDISRYLGVHAGVVYAKVGPDGERPCPYCGKAMPARQSRAGTPRLRCSDCEAAWQSSEKMRMAAFQQEWAARQDESARQDRVVRDWLDAYNWEPPSTIFNVPGVPGFWVLSPDKVVRRAEVAVRSEDQEAGGGYYDFL